MAALCRRFALPAVLLAAILLHLPAARGSFLGDDFAYIRLHSGLTPARFASLFLRDWSLGIWRDQQRELRPLLALSYWLDFRLWAVNPVGYRITNLALYALALAAGYALVRLRPGAASHPPWLAALSTLAFALHPCFTGAVDWIAGRSDLLAAAGTLGSLAFFARHLDTGSGWAAVAGSACFAAGLLCKESTIAVALLLPALVLLDAWGRASGPPQARRVLAVAAPTIALSAAWLLLRYHAFGPVALPLGALRAGGSRWGYYAAAIARLPEPFALGALIVAALAGAFLLRRSGWRQAAWWLFWGLVWPVAALLPAAAATYESPRHALIAALGPAVVGVRALGEAIARAPRLRVAWGLVGLTALALLGGETARQVRDYARMGRASSELSRLVATLPDEHDELSVIVSVPRSDEALFWDLTLPFAAEPPFQRRPRALLSVPELYCCTDWLDVNRSLFLKLTEASQRSVYRVEYDPGRERFVAARVANPIAPGAPLPASFDEAREWILAIARARRGPTS